MSDEQELNSVDRELETALRSIRPAPPVSDLPAAAVATWRSAARRRRRLRQTAVAAALLIGGIGVWMALRPQPPFIRDTLRATAGVDQRTRTGAGAPVPPPTVRAYRAAIAKSGAEFEGLLARHGKSIAVTAESLTPVSVLTLSTTNFHLSSGEL